VQSPGENDVPAGNALKLTVPDGLAPLGISGWATWTVQRRLIDSPWLALVTWPALGCWQLALVRRG
jgi:hypothetical protein